MDINATSAPSANKPSQRVLTRYTTGDESVQNRFNRCCKHKREGSSLRGVSRITGLAYNTVVSIVRSASSKAQLVHNEQVEQVVTEDLSADEMWSFVQKNRSNVFPMS